MPVLRIHLNPMMLAQARRGDFPFLNRVADTVREQGWQVELAPAGPAAHDIPPPPDHYALFHMKRPIHPRTLTFRRAYHFPFWRIEPVAERWRFAVARERFDPDRVDPGRAREFARRLAQRVLPGPQPPRGDHILVPLQGQLRRTRSFQTMSPVRMLDAVCRTGRPVAATLHPSEGLDADDIAALADLKARHPNLTLGGDTMALLRGCAFVATQNSAVAFDGMILGKPAVLFAQIDFHHAALNVADLGADAALAAAETADGDADRYLWWFLKDRSIDVPAPSAADRILASLRRGGWPI